MRLSLLVHPFKVILDTFQDCFSATFAKSFDKPCLSRTIRLRVIATAASRKHVGRNRAWTNRVNQGDKVFSRDFRLSQEARLIAAVSACESPVLKTAPPILSGESIWKCSFSCSMLLLFNLPDVWMASAILIYLVAVNSRVLSSSAPSTFNIQFSSGALVIQVVIADMFAIFNSPSFLLRMHFAGIGLFPSFGVLTQTFAAPRAIALSVAIFNKLRQGKFFQAFCTELEGQGNVQHRNLLSLRLGEVVGAAPRKAVVERFMRPLQAQRHYTTGVV